MSSQVAEDLPQYREGLRSGWLDARLCFRSMIAENWPADFDYPRRTNFFAMGYRDGRNMQRNGKPFPASAEP